MKSITRIEISNYIYVLLMVFIFMASTVKGQSLRLTAINSTSLFGTNTTLLTTITVEGADSGARTTIPVKITKDVIAIRSSQAETGVYLK